MPPLPSAACRTPPALPLSHTHPPAKRHLGNTEMAGPAGRRRCFRGHGATWHHLARMSLPPFVDLRHTVGTLPRARGRSENLLDAALAATHIVFVSPVYWFSIPSPAQDLSGSLGGWMRVPGLPSRNRMAAKSLFLITTSGDRAKAQPMIDSVELCAKFCPCPGAAPPGGRVGRPVRCRQMRRPWHRPRTFAIKIRAAGAFCISVRARFHSNST